MHNDDVRDALARVTRQTAGMFGPAGLASEDVALLREDHRARMAQAERTIAETARILASAPARRPSPPRAESPAQRQLREKITILAARTADLNLSLQLEVLRRAFNRPPNSN